MNKNKTAIFIVPRSSFDWRGNEAGWITTAGWAGAGKQLWGDAVITTTDGVFSPAEVMLFPQVIDHQQSKTTLKTNIRKLIPEVFITALKDWKLKKSKPREWPIENYRGLNGKEVKLVWERHDLFSGPGRKLADRYNVPLVISVEALAVWEAEKWGVKRPIWGKWLEEDVEAKSLRESDLVCCVSKEVKDKVVSMGIPERKVIITPNRVDSNLFNPNIDGSNIEDLHQLHNKTVIGWTGSFRGFHALDNVVSAFGKIHKRFPETVLILVGDGLEFQKIEALVEKLQLGDAVIMTGRKKFNEVPEYVANFDIAVVSARSAEGFHYSPLKLREYMAAGKAVVAPNAGDLSEIFKDGEDLLLYEPGNIENLAKKISVLIENKDKHQLLKDNAIAWFEREGSWAHELKRVCNILNIAH